MQKLNFGTLSKHIVEEKAINNIYDPVLIGLIRRSMPNLIAYDIIGVQPMTGPSNGLAGLRSRYTQQPQQIEVETWQTKSRKMLKKILMSSSLMVLNMFERIRKSSWKSL